MGNMTLVCEDIALAENRVTLSDKSIVTVLPTRIRTMTSPQLPQPDAHSACPKAKKFCVQRVPGLVRPSHSMHIGWGGHGMIQRDLSPTAMVACMTLPTCTLRGRPFPR